MHAGGKATHCGWGVERLQALIQVDHTEVHWGEWEEARVRPWGEWEEARVRPVQYKVIRTVYKSRGANSYPSQNHKLFA